MYSSSVSDFLDKSCKSDFFAANLVLNWPKIDLGTFLKTDKSKQFFLNCNISL